MTYFSLCVKVVTKMSIHILLFLKLYDVQGSVEESGPRVTHASHADPSRGSSGSVSSPVILPYQKYVFFLYRFIFLWTFRGLHGGILQFSVGDLVQICTDMERMKILQRGDISFSCGKGFSSLFIRYVNQ
jgi:hypothetical protein